MNTEPQIEHRWLQRLLGEWTHESVCSMNSGKPPERFSGTEIVRSLGKFWVVCEGNVVMRGGGVETTLMTLGYDPRKRQFVGSWVGSKMASLWLYRGFLDAAENVLTLETEGPDCVGDGKQVLDRDVVEFRSENHRVRTMHRLGDDGNWRPFRTVNYWRQSPADHKVLKI